MARLNERDVIESTRLRWYGSQTEQIDFRWRVEYCVFKLIQIELFRDVEEVSACVTWAFAEVMLD